MNKSLPLLRLQQSFWSSYYNLYAFEKAVLNRARQKKTFFQEAPRYILINEWCLNYAQSSYEWKMQEVLRILFDESPGSVSLSSLTTES
jgi:hypothetical protein